MGLFGYLGHKIGWALHGFDAPWNHEDFSLVGTVSKGLVTGTILTGVFLGYSGSNLGRFGDNGFSKLESLKTLAPLSQRGSVDSGIYLAPREDSYLSDSFNLPYEISTPLYEGSGNVSSNALFLRDLDRRATSL